MGVAFHNRGSEHKGEESVHRVGGWALSFEGKALLRPELRCWTEANIPAMYIICSEVTLKEKEI